MPRNKTTGNLALAGFDDIFTNGVTAIKGETIVEIPLEELHPPEFHPFLVNDDAAMERLVKSIKQYGVREPGLARPHSEGGYELLSGNRRKRACELAGIDTMPVIIREMDDDSAAIAMVDSNLEQREKLLYSEKAWAYRVKLEALNHRGTKSEEPGELSVEVLCEQTGESKNQIFRLIRLTYLILDFLDMVDTKKIAFNPAVELSYLTLKEQALVADKMAEYEVKPSLSQAQRLKKASQKDGLTADTAKTILSEPKKVTDAAKGAITHFRRFFPESYTLSEMEGVIIGLLTGWQAGQ